MPALAVILLFAGLLLYASNKAKKEREAPQLPETSLPPPALPPPPPAPPPEVTSPGQPSGNVPPPELQREIDRYLRDVNNPLILVFFADVLEARGYVEAANLLRAKAQALQTGVSGVSQSPWPTPPRNPKDFASWVQAFVKRGVGAAYDKPACCTSCKQGGECEASCPG